jgi:hypothetical protein
MTHDASPSFPFERSMSSAMSYDDSTSQFESHQHLFNDAGATNTAIVPKTARIQCLDAEALAAVIRWYACSMFNQENVAYINQYDWDDAACDFDPRVFQAFVWTS